jgi:hypothetical protein
MSSSPAAGIIPPSLLLNKRLVRGGVFARATTDDGSGEPGWGKGNGQPLTNAEENLIEAVGVAVLGATLNVFALVYFALLMVSA